MQMLDEKMKSLNIKLSGRVLRKIVPIYESNNKEELYSKIGAGIIDLKDLDKVLKVNSKSKILKFWTLFINKRKTRRATTRRLSTTRAKRRRMQRTRPKNSRKHPSSR